MASQILLWILTSLVGVVAFLLWHILMTMTKRLNSHSDRMNEIEGNYLTRFEKVNTSIHDTREAILVETAELKVLLAINGISSK